MKKVLLLIFCSIFLYAGLLDFRDISKAQNSYNKGDYKSAISEYRKIKDKDGAAYDLANSYYKAKDYKKALSEYKKVSDPKLKFKKLHNMGNTYANLGKIDEAIKSYEEALKIKKDKDTLYNLNLLKKQKKKHKKQNKKKKKQQKKKKKKNSKKNKKSGKNKKKDKNQKKQQNKKNQKKKGNNKKQNKQKTKGEKQKQKQKQNQNKNKKNKNKNEKQKQMQKQMQKKKKVQPISDMEERKYKKMLNQRGINTLLLPLSTKGEKRNEENPW